MSNYDVVLEHAPDFIALIDEQGRFAFANPAMSRILGYTPEALAGTPAIDLVHPDDVMPAALAIRDTVAGSSLHGSLPLRLRHAEGHWVPCEVDGRIVSPEDPRIVAVARRAGPEARDELHRISMLLRSQQEASPDGILVVAGDSTTISFNQRFLELWGMDAETAQADWRRRAAAVRALLKDPDSMNELVDAIYKNPMKTFETTVELSDGRTLEGHTSPLIGPDGAFYARIWFYRDITDRIRADRDLVDSEERYRRLVELSPNGIGVHQNGVLRYINTTGARLFGRPASELVGMNVFSFVHPDDVKRVRESAMGSDFSVPEFVEVRLRTAAGEERFVEVASAATTFNGAPATQSVFRDVTDRRLAEEARRESEERYRSLVESSPDPVFVHDGEVVTYANRSAAGFLGFAKAEQVVGMNAYELLGGVSFEEWSARVKRVLAGETLRITERCFLVYAGREAELDLALSPATFSGSRCVQVLVRDVTQIRRAEQERLALERKVLEAQRLESLGVLAGGVAHDFNNLLVAIMGNVGLATMELQSNPVTAAAYLEEVQTASQRAADLARQMLAYSGKGSFIIEPIDLGGLIREMTGLLAASMSRKITVEHELPAGLPAISGDATQIRQVVMNLVINAAEAIADDPGAIRVEAGAVSITADDLRAMFPGGPTAAPGDYVFFEVSDNGSGMDTHTLSRVFEPFFSTKFTGRGLGLASVLGIVRAHKGALSVRSAVGHGTSFRILLPVAPQPRVAQQAEEALPTEAVAKKRVLVVDDEESVRAVAGMMLMRMGMDVVTAESGEAALELLAAEPGEVSLVLMDVTMPGLRGDAVACAMRDSGATMPIVLMSGYTTDDAQMQASRAENTVFLQKPFTLQELTGTVRRALKSG